MLLLLACARAPTPEPSAPKAPDACSEVPTGEVTLPADDAPHDEAVEWWYWTGHLLDDAGRWYGFEHVFFLFQIGSEHHLMAHHAITDIDAGTFTWDSAYQVGAELTDVEGFAFSLEGYTAAGFDGADHLSGAVGSYALEVDLLATKAPVLQHGDGYTDYSFGGYTWYYSRERLDASGTLTVDGEARAVTGQGWFDHQWGDLLAATYTGWDWFALQLDDGREIMAFYMRPDAGTELVGGSYTDAACATTELPPGAVTVTATGSWTSPTTGCTWPSGWTIAVTDPAIELTITPVLADQELATGRPDYWEGAVLVSGGATGRGYVELTGYCD